MEVEGPYQVFYPAGYDSWLILHPVSPRRYDDHLTKQMRGMKTFAPA